MQSLMQSLTSSHDPLEVLVVDERADDEAAQHGQGVEVAPGLVPAARDDAQQQVQEEGPHELGRVVGQLEGDGRQEQAPNRRQRRRLLQHSSQ